MMLRDIDSTDPIESAFLDAAAEDQGAPPASNGQAGHSDSHAGEHEPRALPLNGPDGILDDVGRTDMANAWRFRAMHGEDVRWCEPWSKWLIWEGRRWAIDAKRAIEARGKLTAQAVWSLVGQAVEMGDVPLIKELVSYGRMTASARGIEHMLSLAKSEPKVPILPEALDRDPWVLNAANGTIDLRTGELNPHRRDDYLTKLCPVEFDPGATAPRWEAMLDTIMDGNRGLITFLQRAVGFSLTASVNEQVLFICHGKGANGKSTFLNAVLDTMGGDYAMQGPGELLMVKQGEAHPTERADLCGKRFVSCVEVEEGRRLSESLVKSLTGGDRIRARRMREDFWEFPPTHKLWIAANHKPVIRGTDHGIWRRVKLVPFFVILSESEQDKDLPAKLAAERAGILAWAVRGCLDWQLDGLDEPKEVADATEEYRGEMDVLGAFLGECCIEGAAYTAKAGNAYKAYGEWCKSNGEYAVNQRRFGDAMTERGIERHKSDGVWYRGVGVVLEQSEQSEQLF